MTEWVKWQNDFCEQKIKNLRAENRRDEPIFADDDVILKIGYKQEPLKTIVQGKMTLYFDRFTLLSKEGEERIFPIGQIDGVQVFLANRFEFYYADALYKFEFTNPRCSGYKYMCAIQKIAPARTELA